jgi:type IV pilus assembly protein PilB
VGSSLDCVLAQRLARRLCDWCKEPFQATEEDFARIDWPTEYLPVPEALWQPKGCRSCANTGFRGRLAVTEVMPVTEEIEHLTVTRAPASQIRKSALGDGMIPLRVDGLRKAAAGLTTMEEVVRVTV